MIAILCLGAVLATVPSAPEPQAIDAGTRVRFTFEGDADPLTPGRSERRTRRAGKVIAVGARTLTVAFDNHSRPVEFDKGSVVALERSLGERSRGERVGRGAVMGLLAGAATGIAIGLASGDDECDEDAYLNFCNLAFSASEKATIYGVALGVVGTVGGAVVGSGRGERWERTTTLFVNKRVGVHVIAAGQRGGRIAVSLGF
jgi:hypothetical protein